METDLSIFALVMDASVVVQLVILSLMLASLVSWTIIFQKLKVMKQAHYAANDFEERFWSGGDLANLYREVTSGRQRNMGMAVIFEAGFREYIRLYKQEKVEPAAVLDGVQRAMRVAAMREIDKLERQLPFLATVASTSPYVGLFGTVWGIMNSFRALGNVKQATIAMVAPGIAEALIATAFGLFAAIPAVISYNRFTTDLDRLVGRYDAFLEEFSSILHRQAYK